MKSYLAWLDAMIRATAFKVAHNIKEEYYSLEFDSIECTEGGEV